MQYETLVKAADLQTGMIYWDGTTITVEGETACYVTINFSDGKGLSVSRRIRKTSEIRVLVEDESTAEDINTAEGEIKVTIKHTGYGSERYGNCQCCGKHCSEVVYSIAEQAYIDPDTNQLSYTGYQMPSSKWGHLTCIESFAKTVIAKRILESA